MTFGEIIRRMRLELDLSQRQLGERLGVTQQTIAQYERAASAPKGATLNRLAKALETTPERLIDRYNLEDLYEFERKTNSPENLPESKLLRSFRRLNDENQEKVLLYVKNILSNQELEDDAFLNSSLAKGTTRKKRRNADNIMQDDSEW